MNNVFHIYRAYKKRKDSLVTEERMVSIGGSGKTRSFQPYFRVVQPHVERLRKVRV